MWVEGGGEWGWGIWGGEWGWEGGGESRSVGGSTVKQGFPFVSPPKPWGLGEEIKVAGGHCGWKTNL